MDWFLEDFWKASVVVLEKQLNSVGAWMISLRALKIAEALLSEPQRRPMVVAGLKANHLYDILATNVAAFSHTLRICLRLQL